MIELTAIGPEMGTASDPYLHIVLVRPEIAPNTGTTARLCAGTRTHLHLVKPLGFDLDDRKLKRAGLDYWPNVRLSVHEHFESIVEIFGVERLHLFTTKTSRLYSEQRYALGHALVFGSETTGLSVELRERYAERLVTLPIARGQVRSLNLASSAAIALYEALRQVDFAPIYRGEG